MNRTWRCPECGHFEYPSWCKAKEIRVDRNFDGQCDFAEERVGEADDGEREMKMTNADKIRQMTDEELLEWLHSSNA